MKALERVFENARKEKRLVLLGFVTGGDPSLELTPKIARSLVDGGVDVVELGIPFSDPIADGPSIQSSSMRALRSGATPFSILETAEEIVNDLDVPVVLLSYFNNIFRKGIDEFIALAAKSKVSGVIIPDLPVEESGEFVNIARGRMIDTIFLATPATPDDRLEKIIDSTTGFLYLVTIFGVTGARESVTDSAREVAKRFVQRVHGRIPVAVGFGVSKPEHVQLFSELGVDGVIVGSALVNIIERTIGDEPSMLSELTKFVKSLKAATNVRLSDI